MKKLFASVLAVSLAITGIHVTSYAAEGATTASVEAQKSNTYMSEIDKDLKDFFAKYNSEKDCSKKEKLLDTAIKEAQSEVELHIQLLKVIKHKPQGTDIENKLEALKLKHSVLSSLKTKKQDTPSLKEILGLILSPAAFTLALGVSLYLLGAVAALLMYPLMYIM